MISPLDLRNWWGLFYGIWYNTTLTDSTSLHPEIEVDAGRVMLRNQTKCWEDNLVLSTELTM